MICNTLEMTFELSRAFHFLRSHIHELGIESLDDAEFTDFIQENCPTVTLLEFADTAFAGIRKRPLFVTKQLAF